MDCAHYSRGDCLAKPRTVQRSIFMGYAVVQRQATEYEACKFSSDVWVGPCRYIGRLVPTEQTQPHCPLFKPE